MRYHSDVTGKDYTTVAELVKAEKSVSDEKKKAELAKTQREADAKVVEEKYKAAAKANEEARKALDDFCKKHGEFHRTYTGKDAEAFFNDPFLRFFDFLW